MFAPHDTARAFETPDLSPVMAGVMSLEAGEYGSEEQWNIHPKQIEAHMLATTALRKAHVLGSVVETTLETSLDKHDEDILLTRKPRASFGDRHAYGGGTRDIIQLGHFHRLSQPTSNMALAPPPTPSWSKSKPT
ncbi:MAG: hypothetical protein L6R35_001328 [Caloplaca aegaea]|nr:MAG: hypothetical protein L6R35_001328 [Caloplaca aegaea]